MSIVILFKGADLQVEFREFSNGCIALKLLTTTTDGQLKELEASLKPDEIDELVRALDIVATQSYLARPEKSIGVKDEVQYEVKKEVG